MSAIVMPTPRIGGPADALAALRASTSGRHRVWMLVVAATMLCLAGVVAVLAPVDSNRYDFIALFAVLANFVLWSGLLGRLVLLRSQAMHGCMPGIHAASRLAVSLGVLVTVLLPGVLLLAAGVEPVRAFAIPALGALAGLLFVLAPPPVVGVMFMLPGMIHLVPRDVFAALERAFGIELFPSAPLPLLVAVCTVTVIWLWTRASRIADPESIPRWRRPMVMFNPGNAMDFGTGDTDATARDLQGRTGWLVPATRADNAGPHDPRSAIGAALGGAMGQVAPREARRQWALIALAVSALLVIPFRGDSLLVRDGLLVGGLVGLLAAGWTLAMRLDRQRQRPSGEFAELALLPGLGDPRAARRSLLQGVMHRLARLMLVAFAALLLFAWIREIAWPHFALLVAMLVGVGAGSVLMCLVALAGPGLRSIRMGLVMLPLMIAATATLMVVAIGIPIDGNLPAWATTWTLLTCAYLGAATRPLRKFHARAHAFVLE
ncbi:hypothetical protein LDO31_11330 [Luteimonas sp. XNQY3]|nr:hypothetical protein [Luteimonas sp. XNQY3]MCD9006818.1 hypothetical protein [Luteimonas sp. XNQY3]